MVWSGYTFDYGIGTMTPCEYKHMIDLLESFCPSRICELGSGISTNIFRQYGLRHRGVTCHSIEHDLSWYSSGCKLMELSEGCCLDISGHVYSNVCKYIGFEEWLKSEESFDFVLVDAPNDGIPFNPSGWSYARVQVLDFVLLDRLSSDSIVMYHDSERDISCKTLLEFERLLTDYGYGWEKSIIVESDVGIRSYNEGILGTCPELSVYRIRRVNKE